MVQEISLHFRFFRCIIAECRATGAAVVVVVGRRRSRIKAAAAAAALVVGFAVEAVSSAGGSAYTRAAIDLYEADEALHLLSIANRADQLLCCQMKQCVRILSPFLCLLLVLAHDLIVHQIVCRIGEQQLSPRAFDVVVDMYGSDCVRSGRRRSTVRLQC